MKFGVGVLGVLFSLAVPSLKAEGPTHFDLGVAKAPLAAVRLVCLARGAEGALYTANVAIDQKRQTVLAYVPVLQLGLKFTDGETSDPQYGASPAPLPNIRQHVHVAGDVATVVNEGPEGVSVTVYDFRTSAASVMSVVTDGAQGESFHCKKLD